MSSDQHLSTAARAAVAAVALVGVGMIAWNAAAGLRVADDHARGTYLLASQRTQQVVDCFNGVVLAEVPKGARLHLDIADPGLEQRLTEGPYPLAIVVPPEAPADYLVHVALGATQENPPCPGYTVTITPVGAGG